MKLFEIPMLAMSLLGLGLLSNLDGASASADFTFGELLDSEAVIPALTAYDAVECFSSDGLETYMQARGRPGGYGDVDLWVLRRASVNEAWGPAENLGPAVNSAAEDSFSSISHDGRTLYFNSNRPGGYGSFDLYMTMRAARDAPWGSAVNLGPTVNSPNSENGPCLSADGSTLYFSSDRPGGSGAQDM